MTGMHRLRAPILVDGSALTVFAIAAAFGLSFAPTWVWASVSILCLALAAGILIRRRHRRRI